MASVPADDLRPDPAQRLVVGVVREPVDRPFALHEDTERHPVCLRRVVGEHLGPLHRLRELSELGVKELILIGQDTTFYGSDLFNVTSDIDNTAGSLFGDVAGTANTSTLSSVNDVDISTVEGANEAIQIVDGALGQIDSLRGDLGGRGDVQQLTG